jgi:3-keto-disaccharide hydrolase
LSSGSAQGAGHPEKLFNGRNLTGWVIMHSGQWPVEEGVLVGRHGTNWSTNPEKSGSWLCSSKQYQDFVLELEYMTNQGGNSGVLLRSAVNKNPSFTGYEMQILADHGKEPTTHSTGSLYDVVAPSKNMSKPADEWNQVRIVAKGPRIEITLNGENIIDRSRKGYIGLQNHDDHAVVKFRNIRITKL